MNQLNAALQKAQQDQVTMTNLNSQLEALRLRIKEATAEINDAETVLSDLIKEAKCNTIEELKQVEKTFSPKKSTNLTSMHLRKRCWSLEMVSHFKN